jgi:4'-phosphopantetheinyl transferase
MRSILGRYVSVPAQHVMFSYGVGGKPELAPALATSCIKFNLSHSRDFALLAVTRGLEVGVDIEFIDHALATQEIAERFFSAGEADILRSLPCQERADAFFACWTRKEAYIKALGEGLLAPLDSFEVVCRPGMAPRLLHTALDANRSRWKMYNLNAARGYKSALVVEAQGRRLKQMQWNDDLCAQPQT